MVSITTIIVLSGVINYANSSSYPTLTPSSYPTLTPTGGNLYDCLKTCFLRNDGKLFG